MRQDIMTAADRQALTDTMLALTRCMEFDESPLRRLAYSEARKQLNQIKLEWLQP